MRNREIGRALRRLNAIPGVLCRKLHGGAYGTAGDPDVLCVVGGRVVMIEVKHGRDGPSTLQKVRHREWEAAGATVVVARTFDEMAAVVSPPADA